jgi:lipoprotein-anchoring transpeptidase ErfK/SrfK
MNNLVCYSLYMKRLLLFIITLTLFFVFPTHVSADIVTSGKLITVDTSKQMLYAWDGGKIVHQTKVSTGMYYTPTVKGSFKIYKKYSLQDMKGHYPPYEPYNIKNVPNVMYFYQAYAIHGAYWHNMFGSKYTHGCVNVPVAESQWLFDWAPTGTQVEVF